MEAFPNTPNIIFNDRVVPELAKLNRERNLQHLLKMMNRLEVDSNVLAELRGRDLILVMGRTGTGKSTMANALISGAGSV